jgi:branched-chain amino acid transport system substrate-binding protein
MQGDQRFDDGSGWTRRSLIKAGLSAGIAAPALLRSRGAGAAGKTIKIGLVSPQTGPLAAFAAADSFILDQIRSLLGKGLEGSSGTYPVQIIVKDSQSNPSRAAEVASELILSDEVNLLLAASTPDVVNPVADQAEVNEIPCVTTDCPWQPYFFGRGGKPATGFEWTYHFFWGLEDVIGAFLALWQKTEVEKKVGGLFPNDADGNAWGSAEFGFPAALKKSGFALTDTGRFPPVSDDYTAQISAFKAAGVAIVTGVLVPPAFATFWSQAAQQGFKPKIVTVGKALLFPSAIAALGDRGDRLSTEIWWTPSHPFRSGLTGQSAKELTDAYTKATTRPWTQPIGFKHALFEVAIDVLKRAKDPFDRMAVLAAIKSTDYRSIVGPVKWSGVPVKNVTKTPLVAGQWRKTTDGFDLVICENETASQIPLQDKLQLMS